MCVVCAACIMNVKMMLRWIVDHGRIIGSMLITKMLMTTLIVIKHEERT